SSRIAWRRSSRPIASSSWITAASSSRGRTRSSRATVGSMRTWRLCSSIRWTMAAAWSRPAGPPRHSLGRGLAAPRSPRLPLPLDAAVASVGNLVVAVVERTELGEAGGDQPIGCQALALEKLHDRDGARARQFPVGRKLIGVDRPLVGMTVDAQDPVDLRRNLLGDIE